ncbi:hypothetical protein [Brunnivagina elsteri]|uniref:hypothetical protein n=1 Tax=Brunnivagina elsteri TaxID=1247191 RepID=UPI001B80A308|nr:hypothetical protein [Calothrix elsteri]
MLITHMACADGQIHSEEAKALRDLGQNSKMGTHTIEEMEKILAKDENFISIEDVARQIKPGEKIETMRQILARVHPSFYSSKKDK